MPQLSLSVSSLLSIFSPNAYARDHAMISGRSPSSPSAPPFLSSSSPLGPYPLQPLQLSSLPCWSSPIPPIELDLNSPLFLPWWLLTATRVAWSPELPCVGRDHLPSAAGCSPLLHGHNHCESAPFLPHIRPFPSVSWRRKSTMCSGAWRCHEEAAGSWPR
jgi:hypothetical protein